MNNMSPVHGIRFPGRYIQGPDVFAQLGRHSRELGVQPLALLDGFLFAELEPRLRSAFGEAMQPVAVRHGGECSETEVEHVQKLAATSSCDLIVGIGGGKVLDTAKAVAHRLGVPVVIVPTIAASDAPCSALAVVYRDDGTVAYDMFLPRNPDLVLVDTLLIARAPSRFLAAGIGDALATFYEADACLRSGAHNCMGLPGANLAFVIAARCRDEIFAFGEEALAQCDRNEPGLALERIVEANILLSGIGFESGGVAAAHAIHHGLCELDDVHHHLHGEKVAIGVLAGLLMAGETEDYERVRKFCQSVRLPTRLSDIGIKEATEEKLGIVARRATREGEIIHNEPMPITADMVVSALRALAS